MTNGQQQLNDFMEGTGPAPMFPMGWAEPMSSTNPSCGSALAIFGRGVLLTKSGTRCCGTTMQRTTYLISGETP